MRPVSAPLCTRCGAPTAWPVERCRECAGRRLAFATARAAVVYDGPVRAVVGAWKERGLRRLGSLAADLVLARVERPAVDVIAHVPADPARQLTRGGHPAEALAAELSRRWGIPAEPLLERTRSGSRRQTGLRLAERRGNVRGAFRATGPVPSRVLVVDDVYTSGSTASTAATALHAAGARVVHAVTFARAIR